jgi:hypothetical protein
MAAKRKKSAGKAKKKTVKAKKAVRKAKKPTRKTKKPAVKAKKPAAKPKKTAKKSKPRVTVKLNVTLPAREKKTAGTKPTPQVPTNKHVLGSDKDKPGGDGGVVIIDVDWLDEAWIPRPGEPRGADRQPLNIEAGKLDGTFVGATVAPGVTQGPRDDYGNPLVNVISLQLPTPPLDGMVGDIARSSEGWAVRRLSINRGLDGIVRFYITDQSPLS